MGGLAKICKMFGRMKINGRMFVWDYAADKAVPEDEMKVGSPRWKVSEQLRVSSMRNALQCAARGCEGCNICKPALSPNESTHK